MGGSSLSVFAMIVALLALGFACFCVYFIFKQIEFVLTATRLYQKIIDREDTIILLLSEIRDKATVAASEPGTPPEERRQSGGGQDYETSPASAGGSIGDEVAEMKELVRLGGEVAVSFASRSSTAWRCVCGARNVLDNEDCECGMKRDFVLARCTQRAIRKALNV